MKKVLIITGSAGSGKSKFVRENLLSNHKVVALDEDSIDENIRLAGDALERITDETIKANGANVVALTVQKGNLHRVISDFLAPWGAFGNVHFEILDLDVVKYASKL